MIKRKYKLERVPSTTSWRFLFRRVARHSFSWLHIYFFHFNSFNKYYGYGDSHSTSLPGERSQVSGFEDKSYFTSSQHACTQKLLRRIINWTTDSVLSNIFPLFALVILLLPSLLNSHFSNSRFSAINIFVHFPPYLLHG